MGFLFDNCTISAYTEELLQECELKRTHHKKTLKRYPGVLIGRLAVSNAEEFRRKGIGSEVIDIVKQWYRSDEIKAGCRMLIVDAINKPDVLAFYRKNGFETLFTSEQQEDFYVNPPKDEEQRLMRLANPQVLETRLMFTDLLKD